jgi:hypothetical protein
LDGALIESTQDSVLWNAHAKAAPIEIALQLTSEQSAKVDPASMTRDLRLPRSVTIDTRNTTDAIQVDAINYIVADTVVSPDRAGVSGLRVQIVDKNVGKDVDLIETVTDERGHYQASFTVETSRLSERKKTEPDLQARVFAGQTFLAASEVRYNATTEETLNVTLPANSNALPSEHETLTGALATRISGRLSDLKETDEQQDITYLANKTGWDARAVAMAALANQFSQQSGGNQETPAIKPAFYYALFRAGLPADPDMLYHADSETVQRVWNKAVEQGLIPATMGTEIGNAVKAFQQLSAQKMLTGPAPVGVSALGGLLSVSRLDATRQQQFAQLYATNRTDMTEFWKAVGSAFDAESLKSSDLPGDPQITVQAVLCWSEYYNGKWQPAKTSDIDRPTSLGTFNISGADAFDRPKVWLMATDDGDALQINIYGVSWYYGGSRFRFYNSHSLPVRREDPPGQFPLFHFIARFMHDSGNLFNINYFNLYTDTDITRDVMTNQLSYSTVQPHHPLQNIFGALFFYSDSRHVFFVTTVEEQLMIIEFPGFGFPVNPGFKQAVEIPPLVLQLDSRKEIGPNLFGAGRPVEARTDFGDPSPVRRFVTEDAHIRLGIGTTGGVMFGGKQIGPTRAIPRITQEK